MASLELRSMTAARSLGSYRRIVTAGQSIMHGTSHVSMALINGRIANQAAYEGRVAARYDDSLTAWRRAPTAVKRCEWQQYLAGF